MRNGILSIATTPTQKKHSGNSDTQGTHYETCGALYFTRMEILHGVDTKVPKAICYINIDFELKALISSNLPSSNKTQFTKITLEGFGMFQLLISDYVYIYIYIYIYKISLA